MQAARSLQVRGGSTTARMILGRLARVAPVRAGANAHCECLLRVEGQNAQRRNEEMNE